MEFPSEPLPFKITASPMSKRTSMPNLAR